MGLDRKYLVWSLAYVAAGMALGIYMAASHDHAQHVTHAHILLVGFVVSFIYAVIHKLWLGEQTSLLPRLQFVVHQAAAVILLAGLFLLYGSFVPGEKIEPVLASGSVAILIAALMMFAMVLRKKQGAG